MHAQFHEFAELLAEVRPSTIAAETNTGWISMADFHRLAVIVQAGAVTTSVDVDIEIATDDSATGLHTLKSATQLTDVGTVILNVLADELLIPSGAPSKEYTHVRVEVTPVGNADVSLMVLGYEARHRPVTNNFTEAVE